MLTSNETFANLAEQGDNNNRSEESYEISRRLLGAVVHRWLLGLHQYISYLDDGDTGFLFCARAGVRIEALYRRFCADFPASHTPRGEMLWASRVSICKGTYARVPDRAAHLIAKEYHHLPIRNVIEGLLRHQPERLARIDLQRNEYRAHGNVFPGWLKGPTEGARAIGAYFKVCGEALDDYVAALAAGRKRMVLIDSGWQGSMQSLLAEAYPDIAWKGLYFGRILHEGHDKRITDDVIGILFQSDTYNPSFPATAFVRHRHIIESLLEPSGPSIEEIPAGPLKAVADRLIAANSESEPTAVSDPLYAGVLDYLAREGRGAGIGQIEARYQAAMKELARVIIHPSRAEARALACKQRSADFGKTLTVPVLLSGDEGHGADDRIRRSLWTEGQIALEYTGGTARDMQLRAAGVEDSVFYFDPHGIAMPGSSRNEDEPRVAIITRTKNRPILLRRAALSVASQTYGNYIWVVVNDGGDEDAVRGIIDECAVDRRKIVLVSNARSLGMEAASNTGIRNSASDLIVIHDDDDSWKPTFLARTTGFLSSPGGKRYGGVMAHATYISEVVANGTVVEIARRPYMDWVRNVHIAEMAAGNMFAPISFVFRRSVWEDIGGYNEKLPVLGDWYFNLEFLLRADIGVIPEQLALYHHRDTGDASAYANSVIGGISKHEEFTAIARNEFLRRNLRDHPAAAALIAGYMLGDVRGRFASMPKIVPGAGATSFQESQSATDRLWVIAHINKGLAERARKLFTKPIKPVDPSATWEEIFDRLRTTPANVPTPDDFDDNAYLANNQDVARAVREGWLPSGFYHYVLHGVREGRPRPTRTQNG